MTTSQDDDRAKTGPLMLVIADDGGAVAERLPGISAPLDAAMLHQIIGGHFEAVGGLYLGDRWIAYTIEDERDLPTARRNMQADAMIRAMGFVPMSVVLGPVVFLGRDGADEIDVPESLLSLARAAGVLAA